MTRKAALKKLCKWAELSLNGSTKEHVAEVREAIRIVNELEEKQGNLWDYGKDNEKTHR